MIVKDEESFFTTMTKNITRPLLLFMVCNSFGYASVHAFYPNMSKFFQTKFQFSNVDAGHISSIPFLVASFSVPLMGSAIAYIGDSYFEILLFASVGMILTIHMTYLL